jgi:hypothetical protein
MAALLWRSPTSGPLGGQRAFQNHERTLTHGSLGLIFARQLLQMGILFVGGIRRHGEVGVAMLVLMLAAWVLVVASVVMIIAPGGKDRGADSKRQSAFVVALCRHSIVALVYMGVRVVPVRMKACQHRLPVHVDYVLAVL